MTMHNARIAIVGAGLSGLYAAHRLAGLGMTDFVVLEARARIGGRIEPFKPQGMNPAQGLDPLASLDLGPTWFWPDHQAQLDQLVASLGLERFAQHETGDMVIERGPHTPLWRGPGYASAPTSMRLVGGMNALVQALRASVPHERVITGTSVQRLQADESGVKLHCEAESGHVVTWCVEHVLLAVPPRLAIERIDFSPALPAALARQWQATATWMAPHAKYLAVYDTPFWREQGLSGEARSTHGPMGEIHDASMPGGHAALFGFLGLPAQARLSVGDAALRAACRTQLVRLFGPQAAHPMNEVIKDWAQDPYTATESDLDALVHHPATPVNRVSSGPWADRLTGIASEWSPQFPGYVAGAIEAAELGLAGFRG